MGVQQARRLDAAPIQCRGVGVCAVAAPNAAARREEPAVGGPGPSLSGVLVAKAVGAAVSGRRDALHVVVSVADAAGRLAFQAVWEVAAKAQTCW